MEMNPSVPVVAGTGLLALDIVVDGDGLCGSRLCAGGTCGNVLSILGYMGWRALPIARLNGDAASAHIVTDLKRWGVQLEYAFCKPACDTPVILQIIRRDKKGEGRHRFYFRCPDCGAYYPRYKPVRASAVREVAQKMPSVDVFFFDRLSRGALVLAKEYAAKGALVVFEPSGIGDKRLFAEAMEAAHVLKYSQERIQETGWLRHLDSKLLLEVRTLGNRGLSFRSKLGRSGSGKWEHLPAYEVKGIVDTAGAGDWCSASIINKLGRHGRIGFERTSRLQLVEALKYGQAASAWNCTFRSARGGMEVQELEEFEFQVEQIVNKGEWAPSTSPPPRPKSGSTEDLCLVFHPDKIAHVVRKRHRT
jgi:sugar/nucleoside kinase (ribokinase family)